MAAYAKAKLTLGILQSDVSLYPASQSSGLDVDNICDCDSKIKMLGFECVNPSCKKHYNVAFQAPKYGYPKKPDNAPNDWKYKITVNKSQVSNKEDRTPIDVQKVITMDNLVKNFSVDGTYYVLPDEKQSTDASNKLYKLFVETLGNKNLCLLAYFVARGKKERYAIVADKKRGLLLALKLSDMAPLPTTPQDIQVTAIEQSQVADFFSKITSDDVTLEMPIDKLTEYVNSQIEKQNEKSLVISVGAEQIKLDVDEKVANQSVSKQPSKSKSKKKVKV